jgi:hypothetical protein
MDISFSLRQAGKDGGGDTESGPADDIVYLPAHKGSQELAAFIPEEGPDQAEGHDDLIGIDFWR